MRRNYAELSSYDFEHLVRDLLQVDWAVRLETFPPGADGGVDIRGLRSAAGAAHLTTIQCKHSPNKTWSQVKANLTSEAHKLRGRKDLGKYWVATSAELTRNAKDKLVVLFGDQGLELAHVLAREDLDNLLNIYPEVETRNYKLYLTSVPVLQRLLDNAIHMGTQDLLRQLEVRQVVRAISPIR